MKNPPIRRARKAVLFISHSGDLYGAERCLLDLVRNLSKDIYPIVVVPRKGLLCDSLLEGAVETHIVPYSGWWFDGGRLKFILRLVVNAIAVARLKWVFRSRGIRLVYSNTSFSPVGLFLAKWLSVSHVSHIHEFPHLPNFDFGLTASMRILNWGSAIIIVPSNALSEAIKPYCSEGKLRVVHNGYKRSLASASERGINPNRTGATAFQILIVGSISENKGQLIALNAMQVLVNKGLNVKMTFVGGEIDVPYADAMRQLIDQAHLAERVEFAGYVVDVEAYYEASDVLVVCSKFETFGRVIIEAMACGCPIVCPRIPAMLELIADKVDGLLYEHNDHAGLAQRIEDLMFNGELRTKLISNARSSFEKNFSLKKYVDSIEEILTQDILGVSA